MCHLSCQPGRIHILCNKKQIQFFSTGSNDEPFLGRKETKEKTFSSEFFFLNWKKVHEKQVFRKNDELITVKINNMHISSIMSVCFYLLFRALSLIAATAININIMRQAST